MLTFSGIVPMFAEQMFKEIEAKKNSGITFEVILSSLYAY